MTTNDVRVGFYAALFVVGGVVAVRLIKEIRLSFGYAR